MVTPLQHQFHNGPSLTHTLCAQGGELVERIFRTQNDPTQETVTPEQINWIYSSIPECNTVVTVEDVVVADAFIVPVTSHDANRFVSGVITEPELLAAARITDKRSCDALYLCSVVVDPAYRGQGLGLQAVLHTVRNARSCLGQSQPFLVAWPWNDEGRNIAEYVARDQNLELKMLLS